MREVLAKHTWRVPVTFTLGSSRQSIVGLEGRFGYRKLQVYLGQCDRRLGCARYRAHLQ